MDGSQYPSGGVRLIGPEELSQIESHLASAAARLLGRREHSAFGEALAAYAVGGGKRVRPQLCVWAYRRCDPSLEVDAAVLDLAVAWELFHAFLLAHDDIIDKGETRRSQPSLHRRLAALDSGSEVFGVNLAIVGGDLLFTAAMELLLAGLREQHGSAAGYLRAAGVDDATIGAVAANLLEPDRL